MPDWPPKCRDTGPALSASRSGLIPAVAILEAVVPFHRLRSVRERRFGDVEIPVRFRGRVAPGPSGERGQVRNGCGRLRYFRFARGGVKGGLATFGWKFHASILEDERGADVDFVVGEPGAVGHLGVHDKEYSLLAVARIEFDFLHGVVGWVGEIELGGTGPGLLQLLASPRRNRRRGRSKSSNRFCRWFGAQGRWCRPTRRRRWVSKARGGGSCAAPACRL